MSETMATAIGSTANGFKGKGSQKGRGGSALKWQRRSPDTEADEVTVAEQIREAARHAKTTAGKQVANGAVVEARSSNGHVGATPGKQASNGKHVEARSSNGHAGAGAGKRVADEGDSSRGKRGDGGGRGKGTVQDPSAASSSTPNLSENHSEFPELPTGDASRSARPAPLRPTSNHGADAPKSSSHMLANQLKNLEQRVAQRTGVALRLRGDIWKLQEETQESLRQEGRIQAESMGVQAQANEQIEKLRERHAELKEQVEEQLTNGSKEQLKEELSEELDAMRYQRDAACKQSEETEQAVGRWRKAADEQLRRLRSSEAKLKSLETKREEHRAAHKKLQTQAIDLDQVMRDTQTEVQLLQKQVGNRDSEVMGSIRQWQAAVVALSAMLLYLLFG